MSKLSFVLEIYLQGHICLTCGGSCGLVNTKSIMGLNLRKSHWWC